MFGAGFLTLGPNPSFFNRVRTWFRQTFVVDLQVSEILGPVAVPPKDQEARLITTPAVPFSRAPAVQAKTSQDWMEMGPMGGIRRQLRRRKGWYDLRNSNRLHAREESKGLLAAADLS